MYKIIYCPCGTNTEVTIDEDFNSFEEAENALNEYGINCEPESCIFEIGEN